MTSDRKRKLPKRARHDGGRVAEVCRSSGKFSWLSRQEAVQAGRRAGGRYGQPYRAYRCRDCRQYHLSTQTAWAP